jgi:hypothetical protein
VEHTFCSKTGIRLLRYPSKLFSRSGTGSRGRVCWSEKVFACFAFGRSSAFILEMEEENDLGLYTWVKGRREGKAVLYTDSGGAIAVLAVDIKGIIGAGG